MIRSTEAYLHIRHVTYVKVGFHLPQNCSQGPKAEEGPTYSTFLLSKGGQYYLHRTYWEGLEPCWHYLPLPPVMRGGQECGGVLTKWAAQGSRREPLLCHSPKPTRRISWKTGSNLKTGRHEVWYLIPQLAGAELSAFQKLSDAPVQGECFQGSWRSVNILGQRLQFPFQPQNLQRFGDVLEQESLNLEISEDERPLE